MEQGKHQSLQPSAAPQMPHCLWAVSHQALLSHFLNPCLVPYNPSSKWIAEAGICGRLPGGWEGGVKKVAGSCLPSSSLSEIIHPAVDFRHQILQNTTQRAASMTPLPFEELMAPKKNCFQVARENRDKSCNVLTTQVLGPVLALYMHSHLLFFHAISTK